MPANYVLLARVTTSVTTTSITFLGLPASGYTDLKFVMSARSTDSNANYSPFGLQINGSSVGNAYRSLTGTGSTSDTFGTTNDTFTASTAGGTWTRIESSGIQAGASQANVFANCELYITDYLSSVNKTFLFDVSTENNGAQAFNEMTGGTLTSIAPITSVGFANRDGSFAANTSISLYGIANLGTTPTIVPKASGGDIVANDGTYWYHAFLSSGTFTPQTPITCDLLVIAGGGGGGENNGGGGAGGLLPLTSQSLTTINYPVTIGAGGRGYAQPSDLAGDNGSNSQFASLTAAVGGGGGGSGGASQIEGKNGGSGGGAKSGGTIVGLGTPGQGNDGGQGVYNSGNYPGGGGGGAGAVGGTALNSSTAGSGGAGSNTYSSWATATLTGVSGFFAGGGGAGTFGGGTLGSGGSGGGGAATVSGTANTGGGGGGGKRSPNVGSGSGGSGIVIIRYAMV